MMIQMTSPSSRGTVSVSIDRDDLYLFTIHAFLIALFTARIVDHQLTSFICRPSLMPPRVDDDWSDSDGESATSDIETSVLLGVPDVPIELASDLHDAAVSRIGGHPVRAFHQHPINAVA